MKKIRFNSKIAGNSTDIIVIITSTDLNISYNISYSQDFYRRSPTKIIILEFLVFATLSYDYSRCL